MLTLYILNDCVILTWLYDTIIFTSSFILQKLQKCDWTISISTDTDLEFQNDSIIIIIVVVIIMVIASLTDIIVSFIRK